MQKDDSSKQPQKPTPPPTRNWRRDLKKKPGTDQLLPTLINAAIIFANDSNWKGKLGWDELSGRIVLLKWPKLGPDLTPSEGLYPKTFVYWNDQLTSLATAWLEASPYSVSLPPSTVRAAIQTAAQQNTFHPVRKWLRGLEWDKTPRLDEWFHKQCGVAPSTYTSAALSKWLISAVARVMQPGCQADHVLVLEGPKGVGKTSFFRILGGAWYVALTSDLGGKDAVQSLWGKVIVELPELSAVKKAVDIERVKAFVTTSTDTIRRSYGHDAEDYPRQCVLGGSTNASEWLREDAERRFWPIHVESINLEQLKADRDQLWAEAHSRYLAGEKWYIDDKGILNELAEEVEARREVDPWEEIVAAYLKKQNKNSTSTRELLKELCAYGAGYTRVDEIRIGHVMRTMGWERKRLRINGNQQWRYVSRSYVPIAPIKNERLINTNVLPLYGNDGVHRIDRPNRHTEEAQPQKHKENDGK